LQASGVKQNHFENQSVFHVDYDPVCKEIQKLDTIKLSISSVVSLDSIFSSKLEVGILYELSSHPIVDSIGYLEDDKKQKWLVFIQLPLV